MANVWRLRLETHGARKIVCTYFSTFFKHKLVQSDITGNEKYRSPTPLAHVLIPRPGRKGKMKGNHTCVYSWRVLGSPSAFWASSPSQTTPAPSQSPRLGKNVLLVGLRKLSCFLTNNQSEKRFQIETE